MKTTTNESSPAGRAPAYTPTPWRIAEDGAIVSDATEHRGEAQIVAPGFEVCLPSDRELIVRAVNSHEELIGTLREAKRRLALAALWAEQLGLITSAGQVAASEERIDAILARATATAGEKGGSAQ